MRLTRAGVSLASAGLALLGLGMGTANIELVVLAALPLVLLAFPLATRGVGDIRATRTLSTRTPRRGDTLEMELRVVLPQGPEIVELHAPPPRSFTVDVGTDLHQLVGAGPRRLSIRTRAHGRGRQVFPPVHVERIDPTGLLAPTTADVTSEDTVEVTPRSFPSKNARGAVRARLRLDMDRARHGTGSADFRELREYAWGDPPKSINWKATARRMSARGKHTDAPRIPLVNEFEHEGRRTVVVLLDGGDALRIGTTLETGLDHGVEAALAAARFFLARGSRVGAAVYGARASHAAPPESGSARMFGIERALTPGERDASETAVRALERIHPHLAGAHPLVVIATRVTPENVPALIGVTSRLRALARTRARVPLVVIDVNAVPLVPPRDIADTTAARLVVLDDARARATLAAAGVRVVRWEPGERDFRVALLGGAP